MNFSFLTEGRKSIWFHGRSLNFCVNSIALGTLQFWDWLVLIMSTKIDVALLRSVQNETDIPSNALHNALRGLQIETCSLLTAQEFF